MLCTIVRNQPVVEKKIQFFHLAGEVQQLWNKWELRLVVLLSLFFQILLIFLGIRRMRITKIWVQILLWIAYLCADWVAAVALGILSQSVGESKSNELSAFWAPFLLLHLGGPDTITAFALEDNELWLRHFLGLGIQGSMASYVSFRSWTGTWVSVLSILMYVPAIVKYGERTWVLYSASKERLRENMLRPPDPGPGYAKFMDEYVSKEEEGFRVTIGRINPRRLAVDQSRSHTSSTSNEDDALILAKARYFFEIFRCLFAFLILSYEDWEESKLFFQKITYGNAFKLIDFELRFMFDVLYTKAAIVYSMQGFIQRSISMSFTICVFVVFLNVDKQRHLYTDVIITDLLFAVAIILEICAVIILLLSDSAILWLRKHGMDGWASILLGCRCGRTRWSNSIGQYSLLSIWVKDKPTLGRKLQKFLGVEKKLKKYQFMTNGVTEELKKFIFQQLCRKSDKAIDFMEAKRLCTNRCGEVLQQNDLLGLLGWSTVDVEFDQSILIWHIATDLCYQSDYKNVQCKEQREMCKLLSDYMVYLLVLCPFMLPEGIGEIRCLDTEADAMNFLRGKKLKQGITEACKLLRKVKTNIPPVEVKGPKSKSVLFDACRLANQLEPLENSKKWETILLVWVEMLSYAAAQCKGQNHAQQLARGGELLTHVWLLMAHLGITEQFEMQTVASKLVCR